MRRKGLILSGGAVLFLGGCAIGPNYKRPAAPAPVAFKEQPPAGWKEAQPGDGALKGKWWELYRDPALNALEEQVAVNNQNVAQAEAQFRQAKTSVRVARASLFPTVTVGLSASVAQASGSGNSNVANVNGGNSGTRIAYGFPLDVSWEPDLWGSIRRGVTGAAANAQSFAAVLENARLLYQSELAQDYFEIHGIDADIDLLTRTEASYQEFLTLTRARYRSGVASDLDVAQAESQLYSAQSALIDLGVQRAQFEHAIANLTGKAPVEVTIAPVVLNTLPPPVPIGVPSQLLERRPDIAANERRVGAANEQVGIAMAALYPTLTISGSGGGQSAGIGKLFSAPAHFWSLGGGLAQTVFDAGRRRAVIAGEEAAYDATVAAYRQTVLTALQQVDDSLAELRILEVEGAKLEQAISSANRALTVATAQYRAGTASYLTVLISQAALLNAERAAVNLQARRLTASVQLIQALGGGWDAGQLPSVQAVSTK